MGGLDKPKAATEPEAAKSFTVVRDIYCTGCESEVKARLTDGAERYPHRPDLADLPFWKCDTCGAYVGCHHKTANRTEPLGYLATPAILDARKKIHALLDPLWKSGKIKRGQAYAYVGHRLGYPYHNGEIKTIEEGRTIYRIVAQLHNEVNDLAAVKSAPEALNHRKDSEMDNLYKSHKPNSTQPTAEALTFQKWRKAWIDRLTDRYTFPDGSTILLTDPKLQQSFDKYRDLLTELPEPFTEDEDDPIAFAHYEARKVEIEVTLGLSQQVSKTDRQTEGSQNATNHHRKDD